MKDREIKGEGWVIPPMVEVQGRSRATVRRKYVKPITHYPCPHCHNAKVAVLIDGAHLVWKPHHRTTMSGAKMLCIASGAPVCANPPRDVLSVISCPHR